MTPEPSDIAARLEALAAQLAGIAPDDFDALGPALAARGELVSALGPDAEAGERLKAVAAGGEELLTRLRVARAGIRQRLQDLHRERIVLNSYAAGPGE